MNKIELIRKVNGEYVLADNTIVEAGDEAVQLNDTLLLQKSTDTIVSAFVSIYVSSDAEEVHFWDKHANKLCVDFFGDVDERSELFQYVGATDKHNSGMAIDMYYMQKQELYPSDPLITQKHEDALVALRSHGSSI